MEQKPSNIMIRKCGETDIDVIYEIINDAAQAYRGVIPEDMWHDPYMSKTDLMQELQDGVVFWGMDVNDSMDGIMGMQDKGDVALIRHAYTKTEQRTKGIGSRLLQYLERETDKPILVGTWADATWAISFYRSNGYKLVSELEKNQLLRDYWRISDRQIQTSVVLAGQTPYEVHRRKLQ